MKLYATIIGLLYKYAAVTIILLISTYSFSQQAWTRVPSPDTSATRNLLSGISGTSSSDVWAVGHYELLTPGNERNLIMHWNGNGWQLFNGTDLSSTYNDLWDVAALSANDVWAVGTYNDPGTSRSQLIHWNGTAWSHTALPNIPGGSFLFSIDAISSNDIWAVGGKSGSPTRPAYTIHYDGSNWTEFTAASPGSFRNYFQAVDGIASNDVWAVGYKSDSYGDFHAMAQHWNGSSWTNFSLPASISSPLGELYSVTMISSNDVWAVGSTVTGNLLMTHWNGTNWTEVSTTGSAGGTIIARGTDLFSVGAGISQWNGTNWTVIDPLNQLSYPSLVAGITFSNGDIWLAGREFDTSFHSLVYRTANATPEFIHGNSQTLIAMPNSTGNNIDEMLKVQDADISQVVIYNLITPPSHGTVNGLPDTVITNNGFAIPSAIQYVPAPGYSGNDQFVVKASVGPLTSQVTLNALISSPLPVLITDYSVFKTGTTATMRWSSTTEINAKEYVMERSADGFSFTAVNRVAAKGSGNNYELVDALPLPGMNFYRLREVDLDGRMMTFPVKSLSFDSKELKPFAVYPNPVVDRSINVRMNANGKYNISLYNQSGQQVMHKIVNSSSSFIQLVLPENIIAGQYILSLVNDNGSWSEKIIIK